ncbi:hypothetical protein GCM10011491_08240 [Brucella endophytica]|uniref:Uncharacterized protein n=1 Tax=Brucella endophytica TaxID=1963359 RepID=A0A916S459_9HYPH|nr:hypothetical protein GCM10011491_08240 [Brucella endophytica]
MRALRVDENDPYPPGGVYGREHAAAAFIAEGTHGWPLHCIYADVTHHYAVGGITAFKRDVGRRTYDAPTPISADNGAAVEAECAMGGRACHRIAALAVPGDAFYMMAAMDLHAEICSMRFEKRLRPALWKKQSEGESRLESGEVQARV